VVLGDERITINGEPAAKTIEDGRARDDLSVGTWDWELARDVADEREPIGPARNLVNQLASRFMPPTWDAIARKGTMRNLRFALYRKGDRLALHAVNYNVCLLDPAKKVLEVGPTALTFPVPADWKAAGAKCYSPDAEPQALACAVADGAARLTLPRTRIYRIVLIEKHGG
jgi:hypothetical protein